MHQIVLTFHVLAAVGLITLILLQRGKGADVGASFGSGASTTVFGSAGATNFLFKLTGTVATVFFATSLVLGYLAAHQQSIPTALDLVVPIETTVPVEQTGQE